MIVKYFLQVWLIWKCSCIWMQYLIISLWACCLKENMQRHEMVCCQKNEHFNGAKIRWFTISHLGLQRIAYIFGAQIENPWIMMAGQRWEQTSYELITFYFPGPCVEILARGDVYGMRWWSSQGRMAWHTDSAVLSKVYTPLLVTFCFPNPCIKILAWGEVMMKLREDSLAYR